MPILSPSSSITSLPPSSGTVAGTAIDSAAIIEHAVRKCGIPTSLITGEMLQAAKENLYLILTGLSNRGLNLWCIETQALPVTAYEAKYSLWLGTVEITNALLRWGTYTAATTYAGSMAYVAYTSATQVTSASVTVPLAGMYSLVLESSPDGVTWTQAGTLAMTRSSAVGDQIAVDADAFVSQPHWRVREAALNVTFASVTFLSATTEIPMAPLNRDDYKAMPNKGYSSTNPLQYWFDKQTTPAIWLWPVPQASGPQVVLTTQRQIQDVGDLTNALDVPHRWLNAIIHELALATYSELPADLVSKLQPDKGAQLTALAQRFVTEAEAGEVDGSPIRIVPAIRYYTRG